MIAAATALMALQALFIEPPVPELSYAQFQDRLRDGRIRAAHVGQEFIRGTYLDESGGEQAYAVRRLDDDDLISRLEERDVEYRAVDESNWLTDLFTPWLLPFGLLFLVWGFVFRRMGAGGAMTLGKSKVKVYNGLEGSRVTFADVAGALLEREVLSRQEFVALMGVGCAGGGPPAAPPPPVPAA